MESKTGSKLEVSNKQQTEEDVALFFKKKHDVKFNDEEDDDVMDNSSRHDTDSLGTDDYLGLKILESSLDFASKGNLHTRIILYNYICG